MPEATLNPEQIIEHAEQEGTLSQGSVDDLISAGGIALASVDDPVILLVPPTPLRNVKYNRRTPPPHLKQGLTGGRRTFGFEGGEHDAIGDNIFLYFPTKTAQLASNVPLSLPNGLRLTYGQIVAMGGDFYGVPDRPISDGTTPEEREQRFAAAFGTLASDAAAVTEQPKIWAVLEKEVAAVSQALRDGKAASEVYEQLGDTLSGEWNRMTGGGSSFTALYPLGRYLKLAAKNWDHFGAHAILAYRAGHAVALQQAIRAQSLPVSQQGPALELAYAMNAFADHFLSDLFSAGHLRAPRKELYEKVTPSDVGSLLVREMHDEDNRWGLNVANSLRQAWRSFGDKRYFDTVDVANKTFVDFAVQDSADEIHATFERGQAPGPDAYVALQRVADFQTLLDRTKAQAQGNISPLFAVDGSKILRRDDLNNLNGYSWKTSWWGWSTLADLNRHYGPQPPQGYPSAPATPPAAAAINGSAARKLAGPVRTTQVRYAVSFYTSLYESKPGPWSSWCSLGPGQDRARISGIALGPATTLGRRIYRQIQGQPYAHAGQLANNQATTFTDTL